MKRFLKVFVICTTLLCAGLVAAEEQMFVGFDTEYQVMNAIIRSNVPLDYPTATILQSAEGSVDYSNMFWAYLGWSPDGYYEYWCDVPLSPNDPVFRTEVPEGETNTITVVVSDGDVPLVERDDQLISVATDDGSLRYDYPDNVEGVCNPDPVRTIRRNDTFCYHLCHGSKTFPIYCDWPATFDSATVAALLPTIITIENGCHPDSTLCDDSECNPIDWSLFTYRFRVLSDCRLFLTIAYCGESGCICIHRDDEGLDVEWNNFTAVPSSNGVNLSWSTAAEADLSHFEVMRSNDNHTATTIQTIAATNTSTGSTYNFMDTRVAVNTRYTYTIAAVNMDGTRHESVSVNATTPSTTTPVVNEFKVEQNYPNPFNSETSFTFTLPEAGHVSLKVFDVLGREVATVVDKDMASASHTVNWSAEGLSTGVYMYTLTSGSYSQTKKMLFLK